MKIARLHNGIEIHFPDDMPDQQMDMEVQKYLTGGGAAPGPDTMAVAGTPSPAGVQPPPAGDGQLLPAMMAAMQGFMQTQEQEKTQRSQKELEDRTVREQGSAQKLQAMEGMAHSIADAVGQLIDNVSEPLAYMAKNSGQAREIVKAINNLSESIVESAKMITNVMMMPVDLNHARDGTPTGMSRISGRQMN